MPQPIDPTANVLALVQASVKRLDDLREAETRRVNEQLDLRARHAREMAHVMLALAAGAGGILGFFLQRLLH